MDTNNGLVLYQIENCPYSGMVRKKLGQLNLAVQLPPVEKNGADRKQLFEVSGQSAVPTLVDNNEVITGSEEIIAYLDKKYGEPGAGHMPANDIGIHVTVSGEYDQVVEQTIEALKTEGFGVLTEIDVKATLKKKIDVDVPPYVILGACNPGFAHKALEAEPSIGLLLPCNVTVRKTGENEFMVSAVHPVKLLSMVGREDMLPIAKEVRDKLKSALAKVVN